MNFLTNVIDIQYNTQDDRLLYHTISQFFYFAYCLILKCFLQGEIRYELIGDGKSPYFFSVDNTNGEISVRNNLKADTDLNYVVS